MISPFFLGKEDSLSEIKEGELYKVLNIEGKIFHLYYGYYEECERNNSLISPMPIYPDFKKSPQYTKEGLPFVTKMQDACQYYIGKRPKNFEGSECAECEYYKHGDELIGICKCTYNRINPKENGEEDG